MSTLTRKFVDDESGAAAAEYAVLVALVMAAVVAALGIFSKDLSNAFTTIGTTLGNDVK